MMASRASSSTIAYNTPTLTLALTPIPNLNLTPDLTLEFARYPSTASRPIMTLALLSRIGG